MTDLMQQAIDAIRRLPSERQNDLARYMLSIALDSKEADVTAEEWAAIREAEAQIARGETVSDETMRSFWGRHGL